MESENTTLDFWKSLEIDLHSFCNRDCIFAIKLPCFQPEIFFHVRYDGNVSLCCEDDTCEFGLGNAFTTSLKEIWWSQKHIKIVNDLKRSGGRYLYKKCSKCYNSQSNISFIQGGNDIIIF